MGRFLSKNKNDGQKWYQNHAGLLIRGLYIYTDTIEQKVKENCLKEHVLGNLQISYSILNGKRQGAFICIVIAMTWDAFHTQSKMSPLAISTAAAANQYS